MFRRTDGKYLIYLPAKLTVDSMFPSKGIDSIFVEVIFKPSGDQRLIIEEWKEPQEQ